MPVTWLLVTVKINEFQLHIYNMLIVIHILFFFFSLSLSQQDCHERKSLQILQQSALSDKALVGVGLTHVSIFFSSTPTKE